MNVSLDKKQNDFEEKVRGMEALGWQVGRMIVYKQYAEMFRHGIMIKIGRKPRKGYPI
jgi:hypothetical protein